MARKQETVWQMGEKSGKEYSITVTKTEGKRSYILPDGAEVGVDAVSRCDHGKKLGVSYACTVSQNHCEEERAAGQAELRRMAAEILSDRSRGVTVGEPFPAE